MSRRKKKLKKNIFKFFLLIVLAFLIFFRINKYLNNNNNLINKNNNIPIIEPEVWPKVYNAKMIATGDALIHKPILNAYHNNNDDTYDFTNVVSQVKDIISKYDIAYYNQETIFGGTVYTYYPESMHFNTPSTYGDAMINAGFNLVSLATNHSADCSKATSKSCLENAYTYWETNSDKVNFDGFNKDESKENKYNINTVNNITYGFLNYTNTLNGRDSIVNGFDFLIDQMHLKTKSNGTCPSGYDAYENFNYCVKNSDTWINEIKDLREKVDVLIVAMHWHYNSPEYSFTPSNTEIAIANFLNTLGVDILLGTHSHCLQPFDIIEKNNQKTYVFYSLGNFISNQRDLSNNERYWYAGISKGQIGMLASLNIKKTVNEDNTKEIIIENIEADLLYTYDKNHTDYKAIPFSKMNETYNKNYLSIYDSYSIIITKLNDNIKIKEAGIDA